MVNKILGYINGRLSEMFVKHPGGKFYGLAETYPAKGSKTGKLQPAILSPNGVEAYVGIDDNYPIIVYHKINGGNATQSAANSYGNGNAYAMTYQMSCFFYWDKTKITALPDEIAVSVIAWISQFYKIPDFRTVQVIGTSVILNSSTIVKAEYGLSENPDPALKSFIQVNYNIIVANFSAGCFQNCF